MNVQHARVTPVIKRQFPQRVIRYSLGAIVQHVKHGYIGVIDHIEDTCTESAEWQARMRISKLKGGGANQPFYSVMPATGNSKTVAEVNLKVLSCAACGDRLAGPRLSEQEVPTGILKSTLKEFESHQMLGYYYWRQTNFGCCGYTMSRRKSEHFPTSLWPAHPNACKDRIGPVDDFIFGRGPIGLDDDMRPSASRKQKPSTKSAFNDGFARDPESEAFLRRIIAEVEQQS